MIEVIQNEDGSISFTGSFSKIQTRAVLHSAESIESGVIEAIIASLVSGAMNQIIKDAGIFADEKADEGEAVPSFSGAARAAKLVEWYLHHNDYPGTLAERIEAKRLASEAKAKELATRKAQLES